MRLGGLRPHGVICANLLPTVVKINLQALRDRDPNSQALVRYQKVFRWLTGSRTATAADGFEWLRQLVKDLRIPSLRDYGLQQRHIETLVSQARKASSIQSNPVSLTAAELEKILADAIKVNCSGQKKDAGQ
jgi:alcohol dehydrogenase class IV